MIRCFCLIALIFLNLPNAWAVLNVTVLNVPNNNTIPLVINLEAGTQELIPLQDVIAKNLAISGYFSPTKSNFDLEENFHHPELDQKKPEFILEIKNEKNEKGDLPSILVTTYDVLRKKVVQSYKWSYRDDSISRLGNKITDLLYEKILGQPGFFDTQISYVVSDPINRQFSLEISNIDGGNSQELLTTDEPILSTNWSPDGTMLAYVTYYKNYSAIYLRHVWKKRKILRFLTKNGMIFSPAWSPDGSKLAVTVSKAGNKDIYWIDIDSAKMQRITYHSKSDGEPAWSANGQSIFFTSNRSNNTQIYRYDTQDQSISRVTKSGSYNAHPSLSSDSQKMAFIHRVNDIDKLAIMNLSDQTVDIIEHSNSIESPQFSPTGHHVIYSQTDKANSHLIITNLTGSYFWRLKLNGKNLIEPAWSPIFQF